MIPQQKLPPVAQDSSAGWMHLQTFVCVFVSLTHYLHQLTPQLLAFEQFNMLSTCLSRATTHKKLGLGFSGYFQQEMSHQLPKMCKRIPRSNWKFLLELRNVRVRGLTFLGPRTHKKREKGPQIQQTVRGKRKLVHLESHQQFRKKKSPAFPHPKTRKPSTSGSETTVSKVRREHHFIFFEAKNSA